MTQAQFDAILSAMQEKQKQAQEASKKQTKGTK